MGIVPLTTVRQPQRAVFAKVALPRLPPAGGAVDRNKVVGSDFTELWISLERDVGNQSKVAERQEIVGVSLGLSPDPLASLDPGQTFRASLDPGQNPGQTLKAGG